MRPRSLFHHQLRNPRLFLSPVGSASPMNVLEHSKNQLPLWMVDLAVAAALALSVFYEWKPTLETRFYQDDYSHLFLAQNPSLGIIPGMIPWAQDWRPLGTFAPFYLMRGAFGLNPFAFHLTNMLVHLISGFLVYRLALVVLGAREFALLAAIFYTLHQAHTRSMQWAAGIDNFLSAVWYLLAFSLYLRFRKRGRSWAYWGSMAAFAAALLTKEWSITLVVVILWYEFTCGPAPSQLTQRAQWKTMAFLISGHCILLLTYLGTRILLFTLPTEGQYALRLSASLAMQNLAEYIGFAVSPISAFESPLTATSAGTLVALFVLILVSSRILQLHVIAFGLGWFIITLSPVLFISRLHPYFLAIPLAGFAIAVAALVKVALQLLPFATVRRPIVLLLAGLLFGTALIIGAEKVWVQQQAPGLVVPQRFADCTLSYVSSRWPALSSHSLLFFQDFQEEEAYFLAFGSAVNVLYNDNTIRTSFIPQNDTYSPFINVVAKPSSQNDKIVRRDVLAAFCANTSSLGLQ